MTRWESYHALPGYPEHPDVVKLLERLYSTSEVFKGQVLGDYHPRLVQLRLSDRVELLCYTREGDVAYAAALVHEYDGNVGECVTICMAVGDPKYAHLMCSRYIIRMAMEIARQHQIKWIAYSHTINRHKVLIKYKEVLYG
jgi:hypothetical protein